ncbi:MAG TPA: C45 family peptidase [Gaiellaceae bacterium]|nr:C45 family peptidase [Gaiellaceae bacterium]
MLPLLDVTGSPHERGRAHGEALREKIELARELWTAHTGLTPGTGDAARRAAYLGAAERWTPAVVEEMRGIAEGANTGFEAIFELNLADELRVFDGAAHCSSLGVRVAAAAPISGQTMDTPAWFAGLRVAVRAVDEAGMGTLAFTVAGTPALCGINSAGVSVWCNALYQLMSSPSGVPVSCVVAHLLGSPSLEAAAHFVREVPHASGQHYLLGSPEGIVSLECSASSVVEARTDGPAVWHANHPVAGSRRSDPGASSSSIARDAFMGVALAGATSDRDLCAILSDRTVPVAKVGGGGGDGYTLWAAVAEHRVPPRVLASAGPPSEGTWEEVVLEPGHVQS